MGCYPFHLDDFFYFYSLQVGAMVISWAGLTLLCTAVIVNLIDVDWRAGLVILIVQCMIIFTFFAISFFPYALGVASAFKVSKDFALAAAIAQTFQLIIWLSLAFLSLSDFYQINRFICINNRCADRFYIQEAHWRKYWKVEERSSQKLFETLVANKSDAELLVSIICIAMITAFYVYSIMIYGSYYNQLKRELEDSRTYVYSVSNWSESS